MDLLIDSGFAGRGVALAGEGLRGGRGNFYKLVLQLEKGLKDDAGEATVVNDIRGRRGLGAEAGASAVAKEGRGTSRGGVQFEGGGGVGSDGGRGEGLEKHGGAGRWA